MRRTLYLVVFALFLAALAAGALYWRASTAKAKAAADCDTPAPKPAPPPQATPPPPFALEAGCGTPQTAAPPKRK